MNINEVMAAIAAVKFIVPALEAAWSVAKAQFPQDKADVQAAIAAIEKAMLDLKGGLVALQEAVKAAFHPPAA